MRKNHTVRVLITGIKGQLGQALHARLPDAKGLSLPETDVTNRVAVGQAIAGLRPQVVFHCAAFTDVDGSAIDPARAYRVNGLGTQNVALAAEACGAALAYISSNEVFDGTKTAPYFEFDQPNPINPYGRSKLAGEWYASRLCSRFYIIRTAWLYRSGGRNFIHAIQRSADTHGRLRVVTDESATPTWVEDLADALLKLIQTGRCGLYHLTNAGYCSRFEFAHKILELTGRSGIPIEPITRAEYPRPSRPPAFTALANTAAAALGITLRPWEEALEDFLQIP